MIAFFSLACKHTIRKPFCQSVGPCFTPESLGKIFFSSRHWILVKGAPWSLYKRWCCVAKCYLDARFRNPPISGFKHVECLSGTPWILSLEKTWFFQLCIIASTLFWSNSMDTCTFNGPIVLRIHF